MSVSPFFFFFFNDTATTEIYTLSLHDALPIYLRSTRRVRKCGDYRWETIILKPCARRSPTCKTPADAGVAPAPPPPSSRNSPKTRRGFISTSPARPGWKTRSRGSRRDRRGSRSGAWWSSRGSLATPSAEAWDSGQEKIGTHSEELHSLPDGACAPRSARRIGGFS